MRCTASIGPGQFVSPERMVPKCCLFRVLGDRTADGRQSATVFLRTIFSLPTSQAAGFLFEAESASLACRIFELAVGRAYTP